MNVQLYQALALPTKIYVCYSAVPVGKIQIIGLFLSAVDIFSIENAAV